MPISVERELKFSLESEDKLGSMLCEASNRSSLPVESFCCCSSWRTGDPGRLLSLFEEACILVEMESTILVSQEGDLVGASIPLESARYKSTSIALAWKLLSDSESEAEICSHTDDLTEGGKSSEGDSNMDG